MSPAHSAQRPLLGIALVVLATFTFATADTVTKHLTMLYPVPLVLAVRYAVNLLLIVIILYPGQRERLWQAQRFWLGLARGMCLVIASLSMGWALRLMPIGETIAIAYLAPLLVMLLAVPLLGERVSVVGWVGAAFGFVGVVLIARPGGNLDLVGVLLSLLNAAVSAAYHLLTRFLSRTETTSSMLFHTAWIGAAIFCAVAIPEYGALATVPLPDIGFMLLLGALMALGHFLFTAAYREAPASLLSPVNYLHLLWAGGLGWVVFSHVPEGFAMIGMALVAISGATIAINSHLEQRKHRTFPAAAQVPLEPAD